LRINASQTHFFRAIFLRSSESILSNIDGNTINNIEYTSTHTNPFNAIHLDAGLANISNNIIGSATGNSAISISTPSGASSSLSRGIYVNASSNTIIAHNTIGSVAISGASNYSHSFEAISKSATSGNITIEYNAIGSPSSNNSIEITSSASSSTSSQGLYAIYNRGTGSSINRYNSIARISNLYAGNNSGLITTGIYCSAGSHQIENNTISNISTASAQTGTTNSASIIGIGIQSTAAGNHLIRGNDISNLSNSNTSARVDVTGIYLSSSTSVFSTLSANIVKDLTLSSSNISAALNGFFLQQGDIYFNNNLVHLGKSYTGTHFIYGIYDKAITGGSLDCYFNTVLIDGSTSGTINSSYALWNDANAGGGTARKYQNNIFANQRTGGSGGNHIPIRLRAITNVTINYNNYFTSSGIVGRLNTNNYATLANWKTATGQDANSYSSDPQILGGAGYLYYYPTVSQLGTNIAGLTTDYTGLIRANPPRIGALEKNEGKWTGNTSTTFTTASNWSAGVVPAQGAIIFFDNNATRDCYLNGNRTTGAIVNKSIRSFNLNN